MILVVEVVVDSFDHGCAQRIFTMWSFPVFQRFLLTSTRSGRLPPCGTQMNSPSASPGSETLVKHPEAFQLPDAPNLFFCHILHPTFWPKNESSMDHVVSCSHGKFFLHGPCVFGFSQGPTTKIPHTFHVFFGTKISTADRKVPVARLTMLTSAWVGDSETSHFSHVRVVLTGGFEYFYFHLYLVKWWVEPPN